MQIRYAKDLSEAFIRTSGVHNHERITDNGLSSPVKIKIQAMGNPFNGRSARQIQRSIQANFFSTWLHEILCSFFVWCDTFFPKKCPQKCWCYLRCFCPFLYPLDWFVMASLGAWKKPAA
uniref:Uncharacterized protein n=1 Tax=Ditylenchus dipsaci TaxID=166011 RepID=A0A915DTF7_9BILA